MIHQAFCPDCDAIVRAHDHASPGVLLRCPWCGDDELTLCCAMCGGDWGPNDVALVDDEVLCRLCQRLCCFCGEDRDVLCNSACRSCADRFTSGWAADGSYSWFLIEAGTAKAAIERGDTLPAPEGP
jgi:hypothetical protein